MKILITGFAPFGVETINPSWEAVKQLPDTLSRVQIQKLQIPVSFSSAYAPIREAILHFCPDVVLNVGQAGGRSHISLEKVAVNLMDARIPDNDGYAPEDTPVIPTGDTAYFSTLSVKALRDGLNQKGIPASVSYSAGAYVCNAVMYQVLHGARTEFPGLRAGFIHVPYLPEQVLSKPQPTPFMPLGMIVRGLTAVIEILAQNP